MPPAVDELTIVPANQASWDDLQTVLGTRGYPTRCQCQRYKLLDGGHWRMPVEEKVHRLREQTDCGYADGDRTSGLVAYLDGEPVGWCAVEPRPEYARLLGMPVPWKGRDQDRADERIWALTCFVIRAGHRRRGYTYALAAAAVEHARERGARAIEGYPMITQPGVEVTWDELHVGARTVFAAAGFVEVSHPTKRRVVMRLELG